MDKANQGAPAAFTTHVTASAAYATIEKQMLESRASGKHTERDENAFMDALDFYWHRMTQEERAERRKACAERVAQQGPAAPAAPSNSKEQP